MTRCTCESCISIDVREWAREGQLTPGHSFFDEWEADGRSVGRVDVQVFAYCVTLKYAIQRGTSGSLVMLNQQVRLAWTPCHFGSERPWFSCPGYSPSLPCGRRVAKLYAGQGRFACRHCWGLAYVSQRMSPRSRAKKRALGIRTRLGGFEDLSAAFPPKPKGMHQRTYERLRIKETENEAHFPRCQR